MKTEIGWRTGIEGNTWLWLKLCVMWHMQYTLVAFITGDCRDKSATSSRGRKRKALEDAECKREFKSIRKAISSVAEAIREGNAITERGQAHIYSAEEVFTELKNIGFEKNTLYRAYIFLMADAVKVRAFFGCPVEERKNFLLQLMHAPPGFIRYSFHG